MIKLHTLFEKNKLNASNKDELFLIELEGISTTTKQVDRKKLNISLCIDISVSMDSYIGGFNNHNIQDMNLHNLFGNQFNRNQQIENPNQKEIPKLKTKLDLVKEASINALATMEDGDVISIVAFDDKVRLAKEATIITKENRLDIINAINSLRTRGSTNIHGGWLRSVEEVAKNVSKRSLNRVVMLTDGQANAGKRDLDGICSDVCNVAAKNVSTSTFGVGSGFNEVLLSSMSDSGQGNFYFINDEGNFDALFNEEFTGLSNVCATGIELTLSLKENILKETLTDVNLKNGIYSIQDLTTTNKSPILFKFNTESLSLGEHNLGNVKISFKDIEGNKQTIEREIIVEVVSESEWDKLPENQEIKVQDLLITVAKNKQQAKAYFDAGNTNAAQDVLRGSSTMLMSSNVSDSRLSAQNQSLGQTLLDSETKSFDVLSKTMHYESYRTLKGKE